MGNTSEAMDEAMGEAREAALHLRAVLARAERVGALFPPLAWGAQVRCGTPGCTYKTSCYIKQHDGMLTPLCGACALTVLDALEALLEETEETEEPEKTGAGEEREEREECGERSKQDGNIENTTP